MDVTDESRVLAEDEDDLENIPVTGKAVPKHEKGGPLCHDEQHEPLLEPPAYTEMEMDQRKEIPKYLCCSIFVTACCCMPLGIYAIVLSSKSFVLS